MDSPSSLFENFELLARRDPGRVALSECGDAAEVSRAALLDRILAAARALRDAGLARGELALVASATGPPFVVAVLAVWALDAVALAADPQLTGPELAALRRTFAPHCVIVPARGGRLHVRICSESPALPRDLLPGGAAVIKLTSGSTGRPRGIAMTADQLAADARQIIEGMGIGPDDVNVGVLPMSHSYGMSSLLLPLIVQGSPVMLASSTVPDALVEALSLDRPTIFPGVPYLFDLLARPDRPGFQRRGLRLCISAGALLRSHVALAFRDRYGLPVRSFYGASETGGLAFDASADGDAALVAEGCVGTPLPGVELDLEGEERRVVARGANVGSGYVAPCEEAGDGEFRDGAFLTGDTGRIDAAGRLELTGRLGCFVNVSGRKVNPREIELALARLGGVRDAAVVGVPDEARGESLVACLVVESSVTHAQVLVALRESLAPWKLPRQVVFMQALPRSARGKLDARALLARARAGG